MAEQEQVKRKVELSLAMPRYQIGEVVFIPSKEGVVRAEIIGYSASIRKKMSGVYDLDNPNPEKLDWKH